MKKPITQKQFFAALPKYQDILMNSPHKRFGDAGADKQASYLSAIAFACKRPKEFTFNYDAIPPLWFSQDKQFCKLFCEITHRNEHRRAIALMPYDKYSIRESLEKDHKFCEHIPFDLFFDFAWVAGVAVFCEPRILTCIPNEAHLDPKLLEAIEKSFSFADQDPLWAIRRTWVMYLMPNNPLPEHQERGEKSVAQAFLRMLDAPSYKERIKNHPQGLSEVI